MLTQEERQGARQYADLVSSDMKDDDRERCLQQAYAAIDMLREKFGSDESAFQAAKYVSYVLSVVAVTPLGRVVDLLEGSLASYAFAAANLAGVYNLPERKPVVRHDADNCEHCAAEAARIVPPQPETSERGDTAGPYL